MPFFKKKKEVKKNVGCYDGFCLCVSVSRCLRSVCVCWLGCLGLRGLQGQEDQESKSKKQVKQRKTCGGAGLFCFCASFLPVRVATPRFRALTH
jgi:hypothetical protein